MTDHIWIATGLFAAFINCFSNYIDQFTGRYFFPGRPMAQALMNGHIYIVFIIPLCFLVPGIFDIAPVTMIGLLLSGIIMFGSFFPYFVALQRKNADQAVPLLQLIPVFTVFLGWLLLGEKLNGWEAISCIFVVGGAMAMLYDFKTKDIALSVVGFMFVVTLFISTSHVVSRYYSYDLAWYIVTFWTFCGMFMGGVIAGVFRRKDELTVLKTILENKGRPLLWTFFLQISDLLTLIAFIYTISHAPTAAHATLLLGAQPIFLIFFSLAAHRFFPKIFPNEGHINHILFRIVAGICIIFGLYLMTL